MNWPISVYRLDEMPVQGYGQSVSAPRRKAGARLNAHTELRAKRQRSAREARYRNRPIDRRPLTWREISVGPYGEDEAGYPKPPTPPRAPAHIPPGPPPHDIPAPPYAPPPPHAAPHICPPPHVPPTLGRAVQVDTIKTGVENEPGFSS